MSSEIEKVVAIKGVYTDQITPGLARTNQMFQQFDATVKGANKTSAENAKLNKDVAKTQDETGKSASTTSKSIQQLASSFGMAGGAASQQAASLTGLISNLGVFGQVAGGAAVAAVTLYAALTNIIKPIVDAGDNIADASKKIGLSTEAYQMWEFTLKKAGTSIDAITPAFGRLRETMGAAGAGSKDAAKLFGDLGIKVKDAKGDFRSTEAVFNDTILALSKIENETTRAITAQKLFGKSAKELAPLLADGSDAIKAQNEASKDLIAYSNEYIAVCKNVGDAQDDMSKAFNKTKTQAMEPFVGVYAGLVQSFSNVQWSSTFGGALYLVQQILLKVVEKVAQAIIGINTLVQALNTAGEAIYLTFSGIGKVMSNIPGLPPSWKNFLESNYEESLNRMSTAVGKLATQTKLLGAAANTGGEAWSMLIKGPVAFDKGTNDTPGAETEGGTTTGADPAAGAKGIADQARTMVLQQTYAGRLKILQESYDKEKAELIKYSMDTKDLESRFGLEKQALRNEQRAKEEVAAKASSDRAKQLASAEFDLSALAIARMGEGRDKALAEDEIARQKADAALVSSLQKKDITYESYLAALANQEEYYLNKKIATIAKYDAIEKEAGDKKRKEEEEATQASKARVNQLATALIESQAVTVAGMSDGRAKALAEDDIAYQTKLAALVSTFDAEKALTAQQLQDLSDLENDNREAQIATNAEYDAIEKEASDAKYQAVVGTVTNVAQQALGIANTFFDAAAQRRTNELNNWESAEKAKIAALNVSARKKTELETALAKEADEKRKAEGEKQKKWAILQAIINGAVGLTGAMTATPSPQMPIIMAALTVASTIAAIATINSQQFASGGVVKNQSGSVFGDNELILANAGERVLTQTENLAYEKGRGGSSMNTIDASITINGNVDRDTINEIEANRQTFLESLERGLENLRDRGRMPSFA